MMESVSETAAAAKCEDGKVMKIDLETAPVAAAKIVGERTFEEYYLKSLPRIQLSNVWNNLSAELKTNVELQSYLPCYEHYFDVSNGDVPDGPPPRKRRCLQCSNKT